jgi:hypothetical protein
MKFRFSVLFCVAIAAASLASGATRAATIGSGFDERGNYYLTLDGAIQTGDAGKLAAAIFLANDRGYQIDALRLNSPGGSVWKAMAMAAMVRWVENISTVVQKYAKCESACFALFAAGSRRYIDPISNTTQIGVHSTYQLLKHDDSAKLTVKETGDLTIKSVRLLKEILVPDAIISKIVTTPPGQMTYLTISDLLEMGATTVVGHPFPADHSFDALLRVSNEWRDRRMDIAFLYPAIVKESITLSNGAIIPAGSVVVSEDNVPFEELERLHDQPLKLSLCFALIHPRGNCEVTYCSPSAPLRQITGLHEGRISGSS